MNYKIRYGEVLNVFKSIILCLVIVLVFIVFAIGLSLFNVFYIHKTDENLYYIDEADVCIDVNEDGTATVIEKTKDVSLYFINVNFESLFVVFLKL